MVPIKPVMVSHVRAQSLSKRPVQEKRVQTLPFITISRQFGCVAYELAERLAARLNADKPIKPWEVYDRKLLEELTVRESITPDRVREMAKRTRSVLDDIFMESIAGAPAEIDVFKRLMRTMLDIAADGHAVIVGRGAGIATKHLPGGVHVRLIAPLEWRLENLKKSPDRRQEATMRNLKRIDLEREKFIRQYLNAYINDPLQYQIVLNCERLTMEEQLESVVALVRLREE